MSAEQPRRLPLDDIDQRLADPHCDLAGLASHLGLPVTQAEAFSRVRRTLLTARTSGDSDGVGVGLAVTDLAAAGIGAVDITAYLAVAEHVHRLGAAEQRWSDRDTAKARREARETGR